MKKIGWYFSKIKYKIKKDNEIMNDYYRKYGAKIGKGCLICTDISRNGEELNLIEIGDYVTISVDVSFITHDYSIRNLSENFINLFGKIKIGKNCFIGERAILMYGVTLADNIIVASGSVVTKSFRENNIIIGGNPAKKIGNWEDFYNKVWDKSLPSSELKENMIKFPNKLIKR